jgi:small GTP-binding protein
MYCIIGYANQYLYQVVFGTGGVGKSSLVLRFCTDMFSEEYLPTIEDCYRKTFDVDGITSFLDILDTAGQEEFSAARDQWVREGHVFILVYSIASLQSFRELEIFREHILNVKDDGKPVPIVLVGNKADLSQSHRRVSFQDVRFPFFFLFFRLFVCFFVYFCAGCNSWVLYFTSYCLVKYAMIPALHIITLAFLSLL